ncbi:MAG TPA: hypothetical protein VHY35_01560 [Stellaceae bacterium]|jgi:hypothetical protein|nr:hypothetical protein [Stellaceae bacterium]
MTGDTPDQNKPPLLEQVQAAELVSRQLDLPMQSEAVQKLAARLVTAANDNPILRAAGPEGLKALIWAITPEDPARMNPSKQAEAMLARVNVTSGDAVVWGKVLESFRFASAGNVSREEGESRRAEASLAVLDLGKINDGNFGLTEFRARGLSFGTFSELRAQGFNAQQIIAAAGLTKEDRHEGKRGIM